ncbi:AbgT family transporter [Arthrobacter tecti]
MAATTLLVRPFNRAIRGIEVVGNKLPHPMYLFIYLFAAIAVISTILAAVGASVTIPGSGEQVAVRGFFTQEGTLWFLENFVKNVVSFPPLITVILMVMAVGVAERTGLINAAIVAVFARAPRALVPYAVAIIACQAHVLSDVAMIVVPALAALVFLKAGRNPIAGLIGSVSCVAAGYSGGMLLGALDTLLVGITDQAVTILPGYEVHTSLLMNWFYTTASGLILGVLGGFLIDRVLEPRCPAPSVDGLASKLSVPEQMADPGEGPQDMTLTALQRRGLWAAVVALVVFLGGLVTVWLLPGSPLQGEGGTLVPSPLLSAMILVTFTSFILAAVVYGVAARTLTSKDQIPEMMSKAVTSVAPYVVFVFVIAQALSLFTWSNVGTLLAVNMAAGFQSIGLTGFGALLVFVVLACVLNLLITSGSALWSLLAPVFVPGFMLLGLSPAATQAAFRIGDSVSQPLSPMNAMLIVVLTMLQQYEPNAKLGTLIARSAIFAIPFFVVWTAILAVFYFLDLPLGPGASFHLPR